MTMVYDNQKEAAMYVYKTVAVSYGSRQELAELNKFYSEGWKLIGSVPDNSGTIYFNLIKQ